MKKAILLSTVLAVALTGACGSNSATGNTSNASNANLPPEFQPRPITPGGSPTPGIPDPSNANLGKVPPGGTPTPGIPSSEELNKPVKPGATPTPGIPSQEEIKKQMSRPVDPNEVNRPAAQKQNMTDGDAPLKPVRKP